MAKKIEVKNPVKVKISAGIHPDLAQFHIGKMGTTVEMEVKDHKYVSDTFKRMEKVQAILKKYYYSEE